MRLSLISLGVALKMCLSPIHNYSGRVAGWVGGWLDFSENKVYLSLSLVEVWLSWVEAELGKNQGIEPKNL